jgi:hypothetical protein
VERSLGHQDPWRRKLHARDREKELLSAGALKERNRMEEEARVWADMERYDKMYNDAVAREEAREKARRMANSGQGGQDMEHGDLSEANGVMLCGK